MGKGVILSLCDRSGEWPRPYAENGYDVISLDLDRGEDVRLLRVTDLPEIYGVLAAPPCTEFAVSGARWWSEKPPELLVEGLSVVDACLRIIYAVKPVFWALENPVGRLKHYIGDYQFSFNPCDFGGYGDEEDAYTKKTLLWGVFNPPISKPVYPVLGSKLHKLPPSKDRAMLRSLTPKGFSRAFYEANK